MAVIANAAPKEGRWLLAGTVVVTETPTAEALGYTAIRFEFDDDVVTISVLKDKDVYDDITYSYEQLIAAITGADGNFLSFDK